MPRSTRALAAPSLLIAATLLTSACQTKTQTPTPPTPATGSATPASGSATPTSTPAAAAPTGPVTRARLLAALPPAPTGSSPWKGKGGPAGLLTPAQYLTVEFGAKDGAKLLPAEKQTGLTFAAQRGWRQKGGTLVSVIVADYRDRVGAKTSYLELEAGLEQSDAGDSDFTLPGAADSSGVGDPALDRDGNTESDLIVLAGSELLHVLVRAPGTVDRATTEAVALQAYTNLCALSDCTAGSTS
ncbi:hypothetical protein [Streptacidiphilus cavernicola]|uniref:DUF3558 domain-containing protein n=1 Tax=Streptacidiphilus cavernicola TaxID=3342716 RepID=A0ABV6VS27_9ACTN